jgi:branched-chain amino acid transport system substrate-binding protein
MGWPPIGRTLKLGSAEWVSQRGNDCAQILIDAIDRAIAGNGGKVPTREQVLRAVAATKDFKGLTGTFSFDANEDAIKPAVSFYNVQGGSWTFWQNAP